MNSQINHAIRHWLAAPPQTVCWQRQNSQATKEAKRAEKVHLLVVIITHPACTSHAKDLTITSSFRNTPYRKALDSTFTQKPPLQSYNFCMSQAEFKKRLKVLMNKPENQVCSDCPERQPRWASLIVPPPGSPPGSLAFGAFTCLECSGSHRRLGVHIAFVRSVTLDSCKFM